MHKEHQVFAELAERSEAFANQQQGVAVFLRRARTHQRDLDLSGHGGDRCAELVRGVGREAAVGLECAVQTIENLIERPGMSPTSSWRSGGSSLAAKSPCAIRAARREMPMTGEGTGRQPITEGGRREAGYPDDTQQPGQAGEMGVDVIPEQANHDGVALPADLRAEHRRAPGAIVDDQ